MSEPVVTELVPIYQRSRPDMLSDEDLVAIALPVKVWQHIVEQLATDEDLADKLFDAEGTSRSIDAVISSIDETLERYGWPG